MPETTKVTTTETTVEPEPERVLGVGAAGDVNEPEKVPTREEQAAMAAEHAADVAEDAAKTVKEVSNG